MNVEYNVVTAFMLVFDFVWCYLNLAILRDSKSPKPEFIFNVVSRLPAGIQWVNSSPVSHVGQERTNIYKIGWLSCVICQRSPRKRKDVRAINQCLIWSWLHYWQTSVKVLHYDNRWLALNNLSSSELSTVSHLLNSCWSRGSLRGTLSVRIFPSLQ